MISKPAKILVIRLSALGDVAMTIPVIHSIAKQHPNVEITFISKPWVKPLFENTGVRFIGADIRKGRKGVIDFFRFFSMLRKMEKWDVVIDLHDVIFSKFLRKLFRLYQVPVVKINKGRQEKKELTQYPKKEFKQLATTFERYVDTLKRAGLPISVEFDTIFPTQTELTPDIVDLLGNKNAKWIGIAPFAQHKGKVYPPEKMEEVVQHFNQKDGVKIILFGGGKAEEAALKVWETKYDNAISVAGKIRLGQELLVMDYLDVMVSMDSANMHLASLTATPVVSIWGATHPYAGFYGWKQPVDNIIQLDLSCRPCSVYGNKECMWGDYRCMNDIKPETIIRKIEEIIYSQE
ncbi:glycosyltransferase family 9 protein [uncultured Acetobacteroides sp.]|uniref:glycosyltransferase family 9 protein n=1 Tax=uncultured Acetobacteroides sp. TaxID=1760811 RepID=UPI0029F543A2|nr:glycosyltransferase family 9 protein [uncultured Acetobacteroides sp.]